MRSTEYKRKLLNLLIIQSILTGETLAQGRTMACVCALFKACSGEWSWKATHNRLQRPYYLSRVDHVWKIRDRKQRIDIRKYSFVNRTIKYWNQLPAKALGIFPCQPKFFRKRVRKVALKGEVKGIELWRKSSKSAVK